MRIHRCTCRHAWQDAKYGVGRRAMNLTMTAGGKTFRCTVCGKDTVADNTKSSRTRLPQRKK